MTPDLEEIMAAREELDDLAYAYRYLAIEHAANTAALIAEVKRLRHRPITDYRGSYWDGRD